MNLYPSILTNSLRTAQEQLDLVKDHPKIKTVQIDVIDGFYADNLTISPIDLIELDFGKLTIDLHLMTEEPLDFVLETVAFKDQLPIRSIIAQIEKMSYQSDYLEEVKKQGWLTGLSLNLHTPVESIDNSSWPKLDIVQLMAIEAGFQGMKFESRILQKIETLREVIERKKLKIKIVVDGGVKAEVVADLKKVGVEGVGVGSGLWKSENIKQTIKALSS